MLSELRERIDEIDENLIKMLNERGEVALKIGKEKRKAGIEITDKGREEDVLRQVKSTNRGPFSNSQMVEIFQKIISEAKRLEEVH